MTATAGSVVSTWKLIGASAEFPAWSTARTVTLCAPSSSPVKSRGLVHAVNDPPSSEQVTVARFSSVAEKSTGTDEVPKYAPSEGDEIKTAGATVSIVKLREAVVVRPRCPSRAETVCARL